jgi:transcriptional regulator with XRE-family HTH domain
MFVFDDELREELKDPEYREAYADDYLNTYIATQIQVLREQRNLSQQELAELIGTKQPGISRLENVNHSKWKTETLQKIAHALDVRLKISFETYGDLLIDGEKFSRKALERPTFADDPVIHPVEAMNSYFKNNFAQAANGPKTEISQPQSAEGALNYGPTRARAQAQRL